MDAEALKAAMAGAALTAGYVNAEGGPQLGKAQAPVRVAVTGRSVGPPLFESVVVLGRRTNPGPAAEGQGRARMTPGRLLRIGPADRGRRRCGRRSCTWRSRSCRCGGRRAATRPRPADAIVVLGAAQYNGAPSPVLANRLDHAVELFEAGIAPLIVVTGGRQQGDRFTEAEASARYLEASRRPRRRHRAGDDRAATRGSRWPRPPGSCARDGITRVVLVSDPYHAMRIDGIADELGLDADRVARRRRRSLGASWPGRPWPSPSAASSATTAWSASTSEWRRRRWRPFANVPGSTFGGGVIGNTTGSGPVIGGSSPPPRALEKRVSTREAPGQRPGASSFLRRHRSACRAPAAPGRGAASPLRGAASLPRRNRTAPSSSPGWAFFAGGGWVVGGPAPGFGPGAQASGSGSLGGSSPLG